MKNYANSEKLLRRELKVSPLAAQTYSKSYRYFCEGEAPVYIKSGNGSHLIDVDDNEFIDFICALGPVTVGYNDQSINEAVIKQVNRGASFSLQCENEVLLAEKLCNILPCAEMVRFVKNGSDATTAAIRLARAYTNKDMILMCGYHGMHDWSIGASENRRGVPNAVCELTKTFEYNNIDDLLDKLEKYKNRIAAIILEPIQGNGPNDGYLQKIREVATEYGVILIFDEVVSGFRYALGGASELYSVVPDLVAVGKGMANGYAISAIAGKKALLSLIEDGVFVSTTFGGDAISIAAALATIAILEKPGFYERIWGLGKMLRDGVDDLINKHKLGEILSVSGLPPHCGINFEGYRDLSYLDIQSVYSQAMIDRGILVFAICNLCGSHNEEDIREYLYATDYAFAQVRKALEQNSVEEILRGGKVNPVFRRNMK